MNLLVNIFLSVFFFAIGIFSSFIFGFMYGMICDLLGLIPLYHEGPVPIKYYVIWSFGFILYFALIYFIYKAGKKSENNSRVKFICYSYISGLVAPIILFFFAVLL